MQFNTLKDVNKALEEIRGAAPKGKRIHYPVLFKKAFIDYFYGTEISLEGLAKSVGLVVSTTHNWRTQYDDGLYTLEGTYAVSKKSKSINESILKSLKQEMNELNEKIKVVEAATKLGLSVS